MLKKYHHKKIVRRASILLSFILFIALFLAAPVKKILALDINYISIYGQSVNSSTTLPNYVIYLFKLGTFIGFFSVFLSLAIAGAMYLFSAVNVDMMAAAKDRAAGAISGLLLIVLTYLIVTTINPSLSILNLEPLPPGQQQPPAPKALGVYFYTGGCTNTGYPETSSVSDLGPLKNKVKSIELVQDSTTSTYYVTFLYDSTNFQGKCQYLDSLNQDDSCQTISSSVVSASIHEYNTNSNGTGVYFYRKSYFNESGGYHEVTDSEIGDGGVFYVAKLDSLQFTDPNAPACDPTNPTPPCKDSNDCVVPQDEQDCVKYDKNGTCITRKCPTLGGENISSIKIDGDYLVLLAYSANPSSTSWTSCQEFPTIDDANSSGPQQIKWESSRNTGTLPNYVIIIPIQKT